MNNGLTKDFPSLTEDETDRLLDGCLIGELRLQKLGREEVPELAGLIPTNVLVVNIDLSQPSHHRQLEILVINGLVSSYSCIDLVYLIIYFS